VLDLTQTTQAFVFTGVPQAPVPSLLRNFSAPVYLEWDASDADLMHLLAHDNDAFNRWESGQHLAMRRLLALQAQHRAGTPLQVDNALLQAFGQVLANPQLDAAFKSEVLSLPNEFVVAEQVDVVDPVAIQAARIYLLQGLGHALQDRWADAYAVHQTPGRYRPEPVAAGKRALKNLALAYWLETGAQAAAAAAQKQYETADNMTDRYGALAALVHIQPQAAQEALADFYKRYQHEPLVIDKWFRLQAGARHATVADAQRLAKHKAFTLKNPNRLRAVMGQFCMGNPAAFNCAQGYAFWSDLLIEVDHLNFEVAARMARALDRWRKLTPALQAHAQEALRRVAKVKNLSKPTREVIEKALAI
jgi:aminopeptidase N